MGDSRIILPPGVRVDRAPEPTPKAPEDPAVRAARRKAAAQLHVPTLDELAAAPPVVTIGKSGRTRINEILRELGFIHWGKCTKCGNKRNLKKLPHRIRLCMACAHERDVRIEVYRKNGLIG